METEHLAKQMETYSNTIVVFTVLQALAFADTMGTNPFGQDCRISRIRTDDSVWSKYDLLDYRNRFTRPHAGTNLRGASWLRAEDLPSKGVIIVMFSLLPFSLTIAYGVVDYSNKMDC